MDKTVQQFMQNMRRFEQSQQSKTVTENAIQNMNHYTAMLKGAGVHELMDTAMESRTLEQEKIRKNDEYQYKVASTVDALSRTQFLPSEDAALGDQPIIHHIGHRFQQASAAAEVQGANAFTDVYFKGIDLNKLSNSDKFLQIVQAKNLEQYANGVFEEEERMSNIHSYMKSNYGQLVADVIFNKVTDEEATLVKDWRESSQDIDSLFSGDNIVWRPTEGGSTMGRFDSAQSQFAEKWDVVPLGETLMEEKLGAFTNPDFLVSLAGKGSPVLAFDALMRTKLGLEVSSEDVNQAELSAFISLLPIAVTKLPVFAATAGIVDLAYGIPAAVTGKTPLQRVVYGSEGAEKLTTFERILYGVGAGIGFMVARRPITEFGSEFYKHLSGKVGTKSADEILGSGRSNIEATLSSMDKDDAIFSLLRYPDEVVENFSATDRELFEIVKSVYDGDVLPVQQLINQAQNYNSPITHLSRMVAASGDPSARRTLHQTVLQALSKGPDGQLSDEALAAVKALGEDFPELAETVIRDMRAVGQFDELNDVSAEIVRRTQKIAEDNINPPMFDDLEEVLQGVNYEPIMPIAQLIHTPRLQLDYQPLHYGAWGGRRQDVASRGSKTIVPPTKPVINLPELPPTFNPNLVAGSRIVLPDGSDRVVRSIIGDYLVYVDDMGVERRFAFRGGAIQEAETDLFIETMEAMGVKRIK